VNQKFPTTKDQETLQKQKSANIGCSKVGKKKRLHSSGIVHRVLEPNETSLCLELLRRLSALGWPHCSCRRNKLWHLEKRNCQALGLVDRTSWGIGGTCKT